MPTSGSVWHRCPVATQACSPRSLTKWFLAETNIMLAGALLGQMEAALDLSVVLRRRT